MGIQVINQITKQFLNLLYPPKCLICYDYIQDYDNLCAKCWNNIEFIKDPICVCCGNPLNFSNAENITCAECIVNPPLYKKARSILNYNAIAKELITNFKYYDKTNLQKFIANLMIVHAKDIVKDIDIILPVPIHYFKLIKRKYNQSVILAKYLSEYYNIPLYNNILLKKKHTPPQMGLTQKQRLQNLNNVFAIKESKQNIIKDKNILLIDDVRTTETTIKKSTDILMKNGAKSVSIYTFAYNVRK